MITKDLEIISGTNGTIYSTDAVEVFRIITNTEVLAVNWGVVYDGTPVDTEVRIVRYDAKGITLAGNTISILGTTVPDEYVDKDYQAYCQYDATAGTWVVTITPDFDESNIIISDHILALAVTTAKIDNLAVTTGKIAALAVDDTKLAANSVITTKILNNNVTLAKIAQGGANTILGNATAGALEYADIAMGASTVLARLAAGNIVAATVAQMQTLLVIQTTTLADGNFWLGNIANTATARTMSGDATMSNTGALTIGSSKILESMLGSATASNITKGPVACQYISAAAFKAKLTGADVNLFAVKTGDVLLDVIVHTCVAGTTAVKTLDIGYDTSVGLVTPGVADDNGILATAPTDASANYSCLNVTYDGAAVVAGALTVASNGYITVGITDGTNLSADATLVAYCIMYYIPA